MANTTTFLGNVSLIPPGITPDNQGWGGLYGFMQNTNFVLDMDLIAIAGGASTAFTLTAAQFLNNILDYNGTPGAGVAITVPTAAAIIAALPQTVAPSGINFLLYFMNDGSGQTVTLTPAAGTSIIGTATVANDTCRQFLVNVNPAAGTVSMVNIGTQSL